jgi:acetyltransferase-like isoleucine patch superfamily enzyme/acyl carrier protein
MVENTLRMNMATDKIWVVPHPKRAGALVAHHTGEVDPIALIEKATTQLHRYEVPSHVCKVNVPQPSVGDLLHIVPAPNQAVSSLMNATSTLGEDPLITQVQEIFMELLDLDYIPTPSDNFFQIGGGSMTASQLASKIRKKFDVACSGAEVFHHSTSIALVDMIRSRRGGDQSTGASPSAGPSDANRESHFAVFSEERLPFHNSFASAVIQLIPMCVIFPMWQVARYLLFFETLMRKSQLFPSLTDRNFATYVWAYVVFKILWQTIAPLVFVAIKWIVIGRYKAGRYPIWGSYYLRWWFVDVCRKLFLKGFWGSNETMLRIYYRMLGAKIGDGARINPDADFAEFDLINVGEGAAVDLCTLRGFTVDNGAMLLGTVNVGEGASVGIRSVVPPGTGVKDGEHLGPGTSAYDGSPGACSPKNARVNRMTFKEPSVMSKLCYAAPLTLFIFAVEQIPPMACTIAMLQFKSRENSSHFFSNWNELMDWLCDPMRIPFFFAIRVARALFSPFFYMFAALIVKTCFIGRIDPQRTDPNSDYDSLRLWLLATIFRRKKVQAVTDLIGRHYESVSTLYRILGAKIGKRVFWPGNQPITDGLFDLLEIGDDVVFGSRSAFLCRSVDHCDKIILCAGSNVSDNCIVRPGTVVSKNAVLGSNSISAEGAFLPSGSVWFGNNGAESQCLDPGDGSDSLEMYQSLADPEDRKQGTKGSLASLRPAIIASEIVDSTRLRMQGDETTIRPVGKAVYLGQTKGYWFLPVPILVTYTWFVRTFCSVFHTMPLLLAVQFGAVLLYSEDIADTLYQQFFANNHNGQDDCGPEGCKQWSYSGRIFNEDRFFGFARDFDNDGHYHNGFDIYWAVLKCYCVTHLLRVLAWLIIELSAKWIFMGRRKPGRYNYNTSSYALRWELYQLTAKIRKLSRLNLLEFISGSPYMSWYFRLNGCKVGKDVCIYPSGADPIMPEPDLVTLGDRTVVDCSAIVCHLNTRGNFELAPIVIGKECTLRARSRLQQGIHMEDGAMLLEKSIAMTGEVLDRRSVWQGGPATMWFRYAEASSNAYSPPTTTDSSVKSDIEMGPV